MKFTCMICGSDIDQKTAMPKLYCGEHCRKIQADRHLIPLHVVQEEAARRKELYLASVPEEVQLRRKKARMSRDECMMREAAFYTACDEPKPTRKCHNPKCSNLTWDFYCPECRRKRRSQHGLDMDRVDTESIWDGF